MEVVLGSGAEEDPSDLRETSSSASFVVRERGIVAENNGSEEKVGEGGKTNLGETWFAIKREGRATSSNTDTKTESIDTA